jgi:hypothetical protein
VTVADLKPNFEYKVRVMRSALNGEITAVDLALATDSNGAGSLAVSHAFPVLMAYRWAGSRRISSR